MIDKLRSIVWKPFIVGIAIGIVVGLVFSNMKSSEITIEDEFDNSSDVHESLAIDYLAVYQMTDTFTKLIADNPIDINYDKKMQEASRNHEWLLIIDESKQEWEKEINKSLNLLYESLSEDDVDNLKKSQLAWKTFLTSDLNFEEKRFIDNNYLGTQGNVNFAIAELTHYRYRALKLKEYLYLLGQDIDF